MDNSNFLPYQDLGCRLTSETLSFHSRLDPIVSGNFSLQLLLTDAITPVKEAFAVLADPEPVYPRSTLHSVLQNHFPTPRFLFDSGLYRGIIWCRNGLSS